MGKAERAHQYQLPIMEYRRFRREGGCYFFTVVTAGRRPLLVEHIARLRAAFRHVMEHRPFVIEGIAILPDHLHALWHLPEGDNDFSTRWMVVKRKFSTALDTGAVNASMSSKREKGIWQRRFWEHCIRDEDDWRRHMDYIHYNPVKHGYCVTPAAWPHSSFTRSVAKGWYAPDWGAVVPAGIEGMEAE
ncbi:MAG: transposase [Smithellaceae bacterium]|nr:transposase [Smithellaceae bacterium]